MFLFASHLMGRMCRNVKKVAFVKIMVRPGSVNSDNRMVCRNLNVNPPYDDVFAIVLVRIASFTNFFRKLDQGALGMSDP